MGDQRLIEQAYRFALAPTPEQERFLDACAGASRFFYNWGLALVETRLDLRRAYGPSVAVPWSYKELCSEFAKVKDEVAPWRSEVVVGSQQAGLEALGAGLGRFLDGRKTGRRVGFPRYRRKGRCRESVIFQRPRIVDGRRVEFDRRLGRSAPESVSQSCNACWSATSMPVSSAPLCRGEVRSGTSASRSSAPRNGASLAARTRSLVSMWG
jgi:hypothetical protein